MSTILNRRQQVLPRSPQVPSSPPRSVRLPIHAKPKPSIEQQVSQLDGLAREAAAAGDIDASARLILELLQCERRLLSRGPQVLQLIKPRASC